MHTHQTGRCQKSSCLPCVDRIQLVLGQALPFPEHVQILTAAHAVKPHGVGQILRAGGAALRRQLGAQNRAEGLGLQGIARQHGGTLPVDHMVGGHSASQIVVVHAGQIVVDQAVGMQHLHSAGDRQSLFDIAAGNAAEFQDKRWPDAFAARQKAVAHGFRQSLKGKAFRLQAGLQRGVDPGLVLLSRHLSSRSRRALPAARGPAPCGA